MQEDKNLPVLNAVIRPGNESIIESTRLGHAVLDELEALKHIELDVGAQPEADVMRPGIGDGSVVHLVAENPQENQQPIVVSADATAANEVLDHELDHPEFDDDELDDHALDHPALDDHKADYHAPTPHQPLFSQDDAPVCESGCESGREPESDYFHDDELELLIDDLVDRHVSALRQDLRRLLLRSETN
jgi:hypothetical protein